MRTETPRNGATLHVSLSLSGNVALCTALIRVTTSSAVPPKHGRFRHNICGNELSQ
ncbi:hypothetical protein BaRGS_00013428, partial [Batillaria attramentaria]